MVYIDYAKAYDSVSHSWIVEVMKIYRISSVIIRFLEVAMTMWKTNLFLTHSEGVITVENVRFYRGIFQGDSLSPILFILAINPVSTLINQRCHGYRMNGVTVTHQLYMDDFKGYTDTPENLQKLVDLVFQFSTDIGMKFGLSKCKVVHLRGGKLLGRGGLSLGVGGEIDEMKPGDVYKYLGIEEADGIKHELVKEKVLKSMKYKLKKILATELNGKNLIQAINESVLPVISYTFSVVNWCESEVKGIDVRIRKHLNMNKMFEIKSDVDRLYVPRSSGGRGLQSAWDAFQSTICRLTHFFANSEDVTLKKCFKLVNGKRFSLKNKAK